MLATAAIAGIVRELESLVGSDYVTTSRADLYIYSQDLTQAPPKWPDIAVLPGSLDELRAVIRLANREKIPVTPTSPAATSAAWPSPYRAASCST